MSKLDDLQAELDALDEWYSIESIRLNHAIRRVSAQLDTHQQSWRRVRLRNVTERYRIQTAMNKLMSEEAEA